MGEHTRSAPSANTRRRLEQGGLLHDSDAHSNDLPSFVPVNGRQRLMLSYSFDTNDRDFHQGMQRSTTAAHPAEYVYGAFDQLRGNAGECCPWSCTRA